MYSGLSFYYFFGLFKAIRPVLLALLVLRWQRIGSSMAWGKPIQLTHSCPTVFYSPATGLGFVIQNEGCQRAEPKPGRGLPLPYPNSCWPNPSPTAQAKPL
eukprot:TRINITY_DN23220_c0_g1_i2.p1 TRINITY_DN23220_c0_g1~~TRINITY_DN23220_c0_g1_i2.p1  ORF type:complete len:101 (-),score=1.50 TRINITY_DN23220_c0_g1_i2:1154-1456(-)